MQLHRSGRWSWMRGMRTPIELVNIYKLDFKTVLLKALCFAQYFAN